MAIEKKAPMILGIGAALAGIFLLFREKKPSLPEPPQNGVVVGLSNPPSGATMWSLTLTDWDMAVPIGEISGEDRLDIAEAATFEIPEGIGFPLRVAILQLTKWNETETALIQLYYVQSMHPFLWDFDIMDYGDEPDPTYREVFIDGHGSYCYNVAEERFEQ